MSAPIAGGAETTETAAGDRRRVALVVNGHEVEVEVEARTLLADTLRHELGLTGTHVGCEQGACGACTVLVDGRPVRSCLLLTPQVDGRTVETVESLAPGAVVGLEGLHPVQAAMRSCHGLQCGFCTPGIVVSLVAAHRGAVALDDATDDILDGHLCRCTGYVNIRAAVREAWATLDGDGGGDGGERS